jgi:hypothetical protein
MRSETTRKRTRVHTPNTTTTTGVHISDERWGVLEPPLYERLINAHRFGSGRPRVSDRCGKREEK